MTLKTYLIIVEPERIKIENSYANLLQPERSFGEGQSVTNYYKISIIVALYRQNKNFILGDGWATPRICSDRSKSY